MKPLEANVGVIDGMPAAGGTGIGVRGLATALRRAATFLFLFITAAACFELAARLQDWVRYRMPILSRVTGEEDLMVRDRLGAHGRPSAQYRKWVMDSLGLRGAEVPVVKPPATVRVVVTGASETFGLYESPDEEYARQLEDTLDERLAAGACAGSTTHRFEVLNAALPGMSLPTVTQDVANRLARLRPDIILYYPSPAQYLENQPPKPARPDSTHATDLPLSNVLHPRALDALRDELKQLVPARVLTWLRRRDAEQARQGKPADWRFTTVPPARLALYESDLRRLVGTIRSTGAAPVIATHATAFEHHRADSAALAQAWERFYPRATGNIIVAFDDTARAVSARVAADSAVPVADVAAALARDDGNDFADFVHFTDDGAAVVARAIAPAVLQAARLRGECGP